MTTQPSTHRCPVCHYPGVEAYNPFACATFEICPCCGTQFGYDDATKSHDRLRSEWIAAGTPWWSTATPPPPGWNAGRQMGGTGQDEGAARP